MRWRVRPMDDVALPETHPPLPEIDAPVPGSFSIGWARSRLALGWAAARVAFMASVAFWLAQRGILDAVYTLGPVSLLFDIAVPLAFGAGGIALTVLTLGFMHAFTYADRPYLTVSDEGLTVSNIARPIAWEHISQVFVHRGSRGKFPVIWLTKGSRYHRRFWPFWRAESLSLYTREPDKTVAMIRAHPHYCGEPDDGRDA